MGQFLGDKQLEVLHTKVYYKSLDIGYGGCEDYDFYTKAQAILSREKDLRDVSNKILKALCYVYKKSSREHFDTNICNFLYYWLGNVLLSKLKLKDLYSEIIIKLFLTLKDKNSLVVCENPYPYMDKDDFEKIKLIFDCSEDYKSYEVQHNHPRISCNKDYKEHLDKHISNYNYFYNKCKIENLGEPYCTAFEKYFPDKNSNLLSQFNCRLETRNPIVHQLVEDHEEAQELSQEGEMFRGLQQEQKFSVVPKRDVSHVEHSSSSGSYVNTMNSQMDSNSLPSVDTPSTITSKSITGAVSVAGALVPSYLLYNVICIMFNKYNALLCTS
ncbi:hypothetical protein PVBG_06080 [Plasmodium vivax Brazil I]|uniref:Variable surface protein Vir7-like protein n=1 Tax=Plasmodium vivax (strain Brazil I) TaxID=1033975 RepID=A0A0J9VND2_PLAV1|nr:hypothetical protein PVBG_06080 [Plasmodium vivax Brazil I]